MAFAAIDAAVKDVATDSWLEHRLGNLHAEEIVLWRIWETARSLREDLEGAFSWRLDYDGQFHEATMLATGIHDDSSVVCSTANL